MRISQTRFKVFANLVLACSILWGAIETKAQATENSSSFVKYGAASLSDCGEYVCVQGESGGILIQYTNVNTGYYQVEADVLFRDVNQSSKISFSIQNEQEKLYQAIKSGGNHTSGVINHKQGSINVYIYSSKPIDFKINKRLKLEKYDQDPEIRLIIAALIGMTTPENDLEFAKHVASWVHDTIPLGDQDIEGAVFPRLLNAATLGEEQAICGDYSLFTKAILDKAGIKARTRQLVSTIDGASPYDTHVTVEIYYNNSWVIVDPTFKTLFQCDGDHKYIGADAARICTVEKGLPLQYQEFDTVKEERRLQNYSVSYSDLLTGLMPVH